MGCGVLSLVNQKEPKISGSCEGDGNGEKKEPDLNTSQVTIIIDQGRLVKEIEDNPNERYDSLEVLGEGAFGKVKKVKHKISEEIRAMKVIHKDQIQSGSEEEKDLIKEINILKTLDHPNIMKVFEYYNTKDNIYIISELLSGGELLKLRKINV